MRSLWGVPTGRSVWMVFVAIFVSVIAAAAAARVVGASPAPPALNVTPHGNLSNGQTVSVSVGPNSYFTPHARVNILECADPGGSVANLPKDITTCDGNTIQGGTILVGADGSFSEATYPVFVLPSSTLGEQSNYKPICNQTNSCVLYVGQNQNDFTAPKVFSAPFLISASSGTTTTAAAPSAANTNSSGSAGNTGAGAGNTSTTVAPTTPTVVGTTSTATASPSTSAASASGALANTGPPAEIAWVVASGMTLLLTGALGRRLVLRRAR